MDASGESDSLLKRMLRFLGIYWKIIFAILWPLILAPLVIIYHYPEARCGYTVLIMAGYWITECFPMAITSLIPVVLFPLFGILTTGETCICYMNDTIMVFIGGLILAIAIQHSNLHMRIALSVMKVAGCSHVRLLGGLCAGTAFISMWVSNTAATVMMVPIIFAILEELEQAGLGVVFDKIPNPERPNEEPEQKPTKVTMAYLMAAAYCATLGGTGTLVGSGTNLTFKGIFDSIFPDSGSINFTHWMVAAFPAMVINVTVTWVYLRIVFMGYLRPNSNDAKLATIGKEGEEITKRVVERRYQELGSLTFHESAVGVLFLICVFLWVLRKPGFMPGWAEMITEMLNIVFLIRNFIYITTGVAREVRDSTPVIFIAVLMFFIPKDLTFLNSFSSDPAKRPIKATEALITWKTIESKIPWSLMFLLGGGFAISKGSIASCLAVKVGRFMIPLKDLPPIAILFIISVFIGFITEFTANVGIANITLPIIAQMCVAMEIHPVYLMLPAAQVCSLSFRLPVGTPPNAIVSIVGKIPTKWLMMGGCGPSIYALIIQNIFFITWGSYIFDATDFPAWANTTAGNNTQDQCL